MARDLSSRRLRWAVVLLPALVVGGLELLSDSVLDESLPFPWDTLLVTLGVVVIGALLARVAYRRIDALTADLRARNAELEARGAAAAALHRVSLAVASLTDVNRVLDAVVAHARELLHADVAVLLLEDAGGRLQLRAFDGELGSLPAHPDSTGHAATDDDAILQFVAPEHAVVRLSTPLRRGGDTIGVLGIAAATPRGFDGDEVETLGALANQATIALEHARLEARLRELAVVAERERIARELHDGIAQVLGYVNTKSQAVDEFLAAGRVDEARTHVAELGAAARAVYVDVREAILGLRSPLEPGQGLVAAVEGYARRVADTSGLSIDVDASPAARAIGLPPDVEAEAYRIVQEALTNVRKHAAARRVRIDIGAEDGRLLLHVRDDGRGLPRPGGMPVSDAPRYGLRSMRERALRIGATLDVSNAPTGGVDVALNVPIGPEDAAGSSPTAADPTLGNRAIGGA